MGIFLYRYERVPAGVIAPTKNLILVFVWLYCSAVAIASYTLSVEFLCKSTSMYVVHDNSFCAHAQYDIVWSLLEEELASQRSSHICRETPHYVKVNAVSCESSVKVM